MTALQDYTVAELEEYGLGPRAIECLENNNVIWLEDLLQLTVENLACIPQLGPLTRQQIVSAVTQHRKANGW